MVQTEFTPVEIVGSRTNVQWTFVLLRAVNLFFYSGCGIWGWFICCVRCFFKKE